MGPASALRRFLMEPALAVARRLFPRRLKRFLKRYWDPNEPLSLREFLLSARYADRPTSRLPEESRRLQDIVCFSIFDWDFRRQRPQHLMSELGRRGHRIFYVSVSQKLRWGSRPAVRRLEHNVWEVQLPTASGADPYRGDWTGEDVEVMTAALDSLRRDRHVASATSVVQLPSWADVAVRCRERFGWRVVFDCMDEWSAFPGIGERLIAAEETLIETADAVLVSSEELRTKTLGRGRAAVTIPNGVDFDYFQQTEESRDLLPGVGHPVVGYYGAIAEWFDAELIVKAAEARPQYSFVLVGRVSGIDDTRLRALPNVRMPGEKPYALMPLYLNAFDVCVIPFRTGALAAATDPLKLYEYFSRGKPVVTTSLPALLEHAALFQMTSGSDEFIEALDVAIREDRPELRAGRVELARRSTWACRADEVERAIAEVHPRLSVVIVTWNNLDYTKLCLRSLQSNVRHPNLEIIVVDNASDDGTREYLQALHDEDARIRVLFNEENRGFAAANNQGIAAATGELLLLLNNDTVVPDGSIDRLLRHLADDSAGLVVAVTNFSGNESRIDVPYRRLEDMEAFARKYNERHDGQAFDLAVAAMYCVAMRRDVHEQVGPLDERFSVGMFEDDDYSHRVRLAGYRVLCAEDAFVHHFGQASFKRLPGEEYFAILEANRLRYEEKWGMAWTPHQPRSRKGS